MYQVETDAARGILRVTFRQHVSQRQAKHCRLEVEAALVQLSPGFRVLTDLSELKEMDFACAAEIRTLMDVCREKGVAQVVRVIPDPKKDIGFGLMSLFHYGHVVPVVTCQTLAEAMQRLA